ncbi:hypothetical protein DTO166G4_304 [Paecilomyces variotii]|nr:hypothetical protein DTO164E3_7187 [Paecilomyces variotii]KAJ9217913.1 hypothetical protein DTO166G4_304 [Paecilomyces variotii]KAJ9241093.1 hypothetical protein DTO166G5_1255 [Paecilomyces variotii]KAJ9411658.1 hypothetical protein DTO045G8_565 [Paecilomyces variotii]
MTRTIYRPVAAEESDLAVLNLSRLLARLEHNLLSPSADLKPLRQSEFHRARVGANLEYARSLLVQIERSLPKIKPVDRRHSIQTDITRKRQTLKLLKDRLDAISADAEILRSEGDEEDIDTGISSEEGDEDLLATPGESAEEENEVENEVPLAEGVSRRYIEEEGLRSPIEDEAVPSTTTTTAPPTATAAAVAAAAATTDTALRNRHNRQPTLSLTADAATATATGSALPTTSSPSLSKTQATESALDAHAHEQESLTDSLLSLATQLRESSQSFQTSLEAEKSVLSRAVEGLDRNITGMDAAGRRMGLLRRMSEGKGWWGRVLMYVWIFGLWLVAVGIVFLGPKLRF